MMKRLRKVVAAQTVTDVTSIGTTYHRITLDDCVKLLQKDKANVWLLQRLESVGWEAIDLKNALFGSDVIHDVLYICCTDGKDIQVGDSLVDPEIALRSYSTDELSSYIVDADDKIVKRYVTEFALAEFDIDESAEQLLKEGKSFIDLMEAAQNLPQLNR